MISRNDSQTDGTKTTRETPKGARLLGWFLIGAAAITIGYWLLWFLGGREILASAHTPEYYAFENAFPLADAWLAWCALVGGIMLLRKQSDAIYWIFMATSAGLYLGFMDVLFDIENGIYAVSKGGDSMAVAIEITVNLLTLGLSFYALRWAWANRHWAEN